MANIKYFTSLIIFFTYKQTYENEKTFFIQEEIYEGLDYSFEWVQLISPFHTH